MANSSDIYILSKLRVSVPSLCTRAVQGLHIASAIVRLPMIVNAFCIMFLPHLRKIIHYITHVVGVCVIRDQYCMHRTFYSSS